MERTQLPENRLHTALRRLFPQPQRLVDESLLTDLESELIGGGVPSGLANAIRGRVASRFSGQFIELFELLTVVKCQL